MTNENQGTVLEVKATVDLTVHLPLEAGGQPGAEAERILESSDHVRFVDAIDIDEIYTIEEY